ncbi:family transcriptional regulator [Leptolyngbya sp. Heron Island J]|uniref:LysR family transcriptional regulator n=1 Tax=Leptolyngbya sp. Heron Island J TaxID=1385935 RepID=UPI0003B9B8F9|nr:LysR family transcriptional regulator [Leptolyngbya sp. Heron Island J]ESA34775.1 family transcriptional regulator [Leptolyngbya sp. Heron Island J]
MVIDYSSLRKLDLNLLLALNVLIEEVSVTRAAEKLNMSQSAMSYALKRLRLLLDDPILIRSSRDMATTPYAREISVSVRRILTDIQSNLLEKKTVGSSENFQDFRIASSDYVESILGKTFLENLASQNGTMRVKISDVNRAAVLGSLDDGSIDLLIDVNLQHKNWHLKQELYREELVCVVHHDTDVAETMLEQYLQRCHILVPVQDGFDTLIDDFLVRQQLTQNIIWSTPHFMALSFLTTNSDYVALLPKRMAQKCARLLGLKILSSPFEGPEFPIFMFWHQRNDNQTHHRWLRNQLMEIAQSL